MRSYTLVLCCVIMASNATEGGQKALLSCKKCGTDHEKPIGNKCEKLKLDKLERDKKRDLSKETIGKKTPKSKSTVNLASQDKMMEAMLASMSSFTEKLTAMEERISGLTKVQEVDETTVRKSRSREKKKRESTEESHEPKFATPHPVLQPEEGVSYSRVFSDTAVTFKPSSTPTKAKNQRGDTDLGVMPLTRELIPPTPMRMVAGSSHSHTTSTITRPVPSLTSTQACDIQTVKKQPTRDYNQNVLMHTDQFGNPVLVQGIAEQPVVCSQMQAQQTQLTERQLDVNSTNQSLEALRANPFIQQLVEERVAVLESRMKSELQQGNQLCKKSGRYNIADTPHCASHLRWPNESYLSGSQRKQTAYDDLTLGQFVAGFITNVLDTQHVDTMKNMLRELGETVRLAENLSWPIARGAFAISMH